jgi:hypothetical protein
MQGKPVMRKKRKKERRGILLECGEHPRGRLCLKEKLQEDLKPNDKEYKKKNCHGEEEK